MASFVTFGGGAPAAPVAELRELPGGATKTLTGVSHDFLSHHAVPGPPDAPGAAGAVSCCPVAVPSCSACPYVAKARTVRLWTGNPFGWPMGGPLNSTKLEQFLNATEKLKGLVDVMSPVAFVVADPANKTTAAAGGLLMQENADVVIDALQKQGFIVEPLVGDGQFGHKIAWYRTYFENEKFFDACAAAVAKYKLKGLNFDFEVSSSGEQSTDDDARRYATMLTKIQAKIAGRGRGADGPKVSVDTGQCAMSKTGLLNATSKDVQMITMNTYADLNGFNIALPRDLARDGASRFSLGLCPSCAAKVPGNNTAATIAYRLAQADKLGVRHVAFWVLNWNNATLAKLNNDQLYWDAIRVWKLKGPKPLPSWDKSECAHVQGVPGRTAGHAGKCVPRNYSESAAASCATDACACSAASVAVAGLTSSPALLSIQLRAAAGAQAASALLLPRESLCVGRGGVVRCV